MLGKRELALYCHLYNCTRITFCYLNILTQILSLKARQEERGWHNIETNVFSNNNGIWSKTLGD